MYLAFTNGYRQGAFWGKLQHSDLSDRQCSLDRVVPCYNKPASCSSHFWNSIKKNLQEILISKMNLRTVGPLPCHL